MKSVISAFFFYHKSNAKSYHLRLILLLIITMTINLSCDSCNNQSNLPSNPNYEFTVFPIEMDNIDNVVGFGTHGSSHLEGVTKWYLYTSLKLNVVSPGNGIVDEVSGNGPVESRITINFSKEVSAKFDHIIKDDSITRGSQVSAGQIIGTSNPPTALDFNVFNTTNNNGFPSSWPTDFNTAVCPLNHLSSELQTEFLSRWDSVWLPNLYSSERCEPVYCSALNINTENNVRGVWFTHQAENSQHGTCIAFTDCDSTWMCGQNLRIRMMFKGQGFPKEGYLLSETDLGGGLKRMELSQCGGSFFDSKYLLYQFQSGDQIKIEISNLPITTFSGEARIYDREWESMWE